jgi:GNAT acetyltransferase-like protein
MDGSTSLRRNLGNRAPWLRRAYWSVRHAYDSILSKAADPQFPRETTYEGSRGKAWCVDVEWRAPSIAAFFCGGDVGAGSRGRVWRRHVPGRVNRIAAGGGLGIVRISEPDQWPAELLSRAIRAPQEIAMHTDLPADCDALRTQLLTSTTRGDFRRIRHANFSYRVTSDPAAIREFFARYHAPLLAHRFPEDGRSAPVENMLDQLGQGGELVCADIDGAWVAGVFNIANETSYELGTLGIRDGDEAVRQKGVVGALIVRSLERAVELGRPRATLGQSLPFLGKGSVWFKAKWGGVITRNPAMPELHMFMDLRHAAVRRMLSATPVIHTDGKSLVVSTWLEPGKKSLQDVARGPAWFPGISRWYVLAEPQTLAAADSKLSTDERIVPISVTLGDDDPPLWLGELVPGRV